MKQRVRIDAGIYARGCVRRGAVNKDKLVADVFQGKGDVVCQGEGFVQFKPQDRSSICFSMARTWRSVRLENHMASRSIGRRRALVLWVQMISPENPASIRSGTRPV